MFPNEKINKGDIEAYQQWMANKGVSVGQYIGVKKGFFADLLNEDDWSFIIKLHAMIEAVCTHLLAYHFQEPAMIDVISRLELSNKATGKIAFLKAAELLSSPSIGYIIGLSQLRNSLVHDVRKTEFSLNKTIDSLDKEALKKFAITFNLTLSFEKRSGKGILKKIESSAKPDKKYSEYIKTDMKQALANLKAEPKFYIWWGAYELFNWLADMKSFSDYKQWEKAEKKLFVEDGD